MEFFWVDNVESIMHENKIQLVQSKVLFVHMGVYEITNGLTDGILKPCYGIKQLAKKQSPVIDKNNVTSLCSPPSVFLGP